MTIWRLRMCTRKFHLFNVSPHCGHTTVSLTSRLIGGGGGCEKGAAAVEAGGCEKGAGAEAGGSYKILEGPTKSCGAMKVRYSQFYLVKRMTRGLGTETISTYSQTLNVGVECECPVGHFW